MFKITEIGAWIATEEDGTEGIPAMSIDGLMMPLIGADATRIESLKPYAETIAKATGATLTFKRFKLI